MTALDLFNEATRRGLQLEPRDGGKLAVSPANLCPPDFADVLRRHKRELLDLLEATRYPYGSGPPERAAPAGPSSRCPAWL